MRLDEKKQSRSFMKKNNSYSHCPLKKRPIHVLMSEEAPEVIKEEVTDVAMDDIPEPENLSTKPEDLSKSADRHYHHDQQQHQEQSKQEQKPEHRTLKALSPIVKTSPSPSFATSPSSPPINDHPIPHVQHSMHQYQEYHHYHTSKVITPPMAIPAIPVAKKGRVEVIQHNSTIAPVASMPTPLHFIASKTPLEPLNLNTPMEPLAHYATPTWARANPLYPPNYLPYPPPAYRYPTAAAELYPSYPVPPYPHSPPEHHPSVSPPPHDALTCPTIQRPIARSYSYWASPDHCGLSPTSSVGSGSLRSPPPVTPEDLSSPGSESGRSSAGSTSAGGSMVVNTGSIKGEKSSSNGGASASSSTTTTTSPRYQCPDCGKSYSTYSGLSKHQQFHCAAAQGQTKKSFSCKSCNKVYVSLGALKMHIRTHTLPCKCHMCGKAFSRPWLLQGHIRTHTGEKPFSCQHCNRAFADRSNLRAHLQTHSDVKKYSCDSCSKTFSRMSLLTKHQEGGCPGVSVPIGYAC